MGVKLMKKTLVRTLLISCFILGNAVLAQEVGKPQSVTFESYDFSQFISSAGQSPQQIIKLDNNGEILLACMGGKTREQLKAAGIKFAESQLELFKTLRLLEENETVLKTAFPILNAQMSQRLRKASQAAVPAMSRQLEPNVLKLAAILDQNGRKKNTYTILFSYILDNLVWDKFKERHLLEPRVITAEMPFWAGEVWATYPPRTFAMGTNTISDQGVSLHVNWTERTIPKMAPFVADFKTFLQMFRDYVKLGRVENAQAIKVFAPYDLFDQTGRFTVPVISAESSDPLHQLSEELARQVAEKLPALLDLNSLTKEFGFRDNKQTLVIIYHEWMWDLMDHLESKGIVQKPVAFAAPERAKPSDIADLVFIVRKRS